MQLLLENGFTEEGEEERRGQRGRERRKEETERWWKARKSVGREIIRRKPGVLCVFFEGVPLVRLPCPSTTEALSMMRVGG